MTRIIRIGPAFVLAFLLACNDSKSQPGAPATAPASVPTPAAPSAEFNPVGTWKVASQDRCQWWTTYTGWEEKAGEPAKCSDFGVKDAFDGEAIVFKVTQFDRATRKLTLVGTPGQTSRTFTLDERWMSDLGRRMEADAIVWDTNCRLEPYQQERVGFDPEQGTLIYELHEIGEVKRAEVPGACVSALNRIKAQVADGSAGPAWKGSSSTGAPDLEDRSIEDLDQIRLRIDYRGSRE